MIPIFIFEYAGLNPKMLNGGNMGPIPVPPPGPFGHRSADMGKSFPKIPGAPSASAVSMLGSLPSLFIGVSNFISIPLAEAYGRRPVMLFLAGLSFLCLPWAATSHGLSSHLAARCFQALGTGAVESLVPLIMQDMSFVHERNMFIGMLWASGVCPPHTQAFQSTDYCCRVSSARFSV
jgi:MFS family permease